jgi:hypothetical protein
MKAVSESTEERMARGIGKVLVVVSAIALAVSSVWSAAAVHQAFVLPTRPWQAGSSFTGLPVVAHLVLVLIAVGFTVAVAFRRSPADAVGLASRGTFATVIGATVLLALVLVLLKTLDSEALAVGPVGEALSNVPEASLPATLLLICTSWGTFLILVIFYGVQLFWSYKGRFPEGLRGFSAVCCALLSLLGAVFPLTYASMAGAAVRDQAVFQDMVDFASTVSEPDLPPPVVGRKSGVRITAERWVQSEPASLPPILAVCVDETLSLPGAYSPFVREGLDSGGVGRPIPELGKNCFTVVSN